MRFKEIPLKGLYIVDLVPHEDSRGTFCRIFCRKEFEQIGLDEEIVQVNHSVTRTKGTVRGLHFQLQPASETKIIRCIQGAAYDVAVDIRSHSPTFLQWYGIELSRENAQIIYIPKGFAHGFQALTDNTELLYHHTAFYDEAHERGLRHDDPRLSIDWPLQVISVSERDAHHPLIDDAFVGTDI